MSWNDIILNLYELFIYPILGALALYLVSYIKNKASLLKFQQNNSDLQSALTTLNTIVDNCVLSTKQTYVDNLKKAGTFDATAQKMAYEVTYNAVMTTLTDDTKKVLEKAINNLPKYISDLIEARVHINK